MTSENAWGNIKNRISSWTNKNADKFVYVEFSKKQTDWDYDEAPLKVYRSYFRIWLCEMFLTQSRTWFKTWFPAVHTAIQLKFGDHERIRLSHVTNPPEQKQAEGVLINYPVTELLPYNGGIVELDASLLALQGQNYLATSLKLLQDFSGLVAAPLGQTLTIASKISNGIDQLLDDGSGNVHLNLHQAFASGGQANKTDNALRSGYTAVILANQNDVNKSDLRVIGNRLYLHNNGNPIHFKDYDYMLYKIEGREERDDWMLKDIQGAIDKAIEAMIEGEIEKAEAYKKVALITAMQSPDLARYDRRRVATAIKAELEEDGFAAAGGETGQLTNIMKTRAISMDNAEGMGELTFDEMFQN